MLYPSCILFFSTCPSPSKESIQKIPECEGIITCLQPYKCPLEHGAQPVPPCPQESSFAPSICQFLRAVNCLCCHRVLLAVLLALLLVLVTLRWLSLSIGKKSDVREAYYNILF